MPVDSRQKRMSAMNLACPWRGPMVDATESGTTQGNRQAAAFMYSGILATELLIIVGGCFHAGSVYHPGFKAGSIYAPGFTEGDAYLPGFKAGQGAC